MDAACAANLAGEKQAPILMADSPAGYEKNIICITADKEFI